MKKRMFTASVVVLGLALVSAGTAQAVGFVNNFGLTSPTSTVTFDELVYSQDTPIDTIYAPYGVMFSSYMRYDAQGPAAFPGITGHYLGNFYPVVNPFSIFFTTDQTDAAFGMATNPATTTITALLNGTPVESFSVFTSFDNPNAGFYGFTGITFDEISISVSSDLALIDNIQTGNAPVPVPGTMLLLGSGLAGLGAYRLRRKAKA